MSRIGRMPVALPKGVTVEVKEDNKVIVKGPKGTLSRTFPAAMEIAAEEDGTVVVRRPTDQRQHRALHGLSRALLFNMVTGVSSGFKKELELVGVGYRVALQGKDLELSLGYSHPIPFPPPEGISFEVDKAGRLITIHGIDKEVVGETAARIRRHRPPEPYKGKGVRYVGETVRIKAGKSSKGGKKR